LLNTDLIRIRIQTKFSVEDPGCLSRIPDPTYFHPGSRIRTVSIPDPGSRILIKEFKHFNPKKAKKWFISSKKYDPSCSSRIPDPDADFLPSRIPDPGVKKAPNPGSATLTKLFKNFNWKYFLINICHIGLLKPLKKDVQTFQT
jgi:hypothetical protein